MPTANFNALLEQVQQLFVKNEYQVILGLLTDKVLEEEHSAELYAWKSRTYSSLDDFESGMKYANISYKLNPELEEASLARGNASYGKEEWDEAINAFSIAIKINSKFSDAFYNRGLVWYRKGEWDKAIHDFSKVIEINPKNFDAFNNRGNSLYRKKEFDMAIEDYSNAIKINPEFASALNNRGNAWDEKRDFDKAIKDYSKAIKIEPKFSDAFNNRGLVWYRKEQWDKAINDFSTSIEVNPENANAYNNRGLTWFRKGDLSKAIKDYTRAIEIYPEFASAFNNRGIAWNGKKEWAKAKSDYFSAIQLDPDMHYPYINLGDDYYEQRNWKLALTNYQIAKKLGTEFPSSWLIARIADCLEKIDEEKQLEAAKPTFEISKSIKVLKAKLEGKINEIKKLATAPKMDVVHYTSLEVAKSLATQASNQLWYSNVVYVNDPEEGKILLNILDDGKDKTISQAYLAGESRTELSVYLGSFLPAEKSKDNDSHEDDLVMWRTYGKDSKGVEAAGCNLILAREFFTPAEISKGKEPKAANSYNNSSQELLRVMYFHRSKKIVNDDGQDTLKLIDQLREILREIVNFKSKTENQPTKLDNYLEEILFKEVSKVAYLFKSADYAFENEVRVVAYVPKGPNLIKSRSQSVEGAPPLKYYIHSDNVVLPFLKKIYLGAKVPHAAQWSIYLDQELRKSKTELKDDPQYESFNPNRISIIKSACQFV